MSKFMFAGGVGTDHIKRNLEIFKALGIEAKWYGYNPFNVLFKKADYMYINWYEAIYNGNWFTTTLYYLSQEMRLLFARMKGIKIVTSFHNKEPHSHNFYAYRLRLLKASLVHADAIVIFNEHGREDLKRYISEDDIKTKVYHIPAINYMGVYPFVEHEWISVIEKRQTMKILFYGRLDPTYKNFDALFDIATKYGADDVEFIFAGGAGWDAEHKAALQDKADQCPNVMLRIRFIENLEMAHLLRMADVIAIPYEIESINNSGTIRLAFSYARTIICPKIPTVESVPGDLVYTYTYDNKEEHKRKLMEQIDKAVADYRNDHDALRRKGKSLFRIMETEHSFDALKIKYGKLFNDLDKK